MSRVKSTNELASIQVGLDSQWLHIDAGKTGTTTISPRDAGSIVVLIRVTINTAGSGSPIVISGSTEGVVASIAAGITGTLHYNLPFNGTSEKLTITNAGAADITVTYKDR